MMASWRKVKLGEVCEKIGSGATPKGGAQATLPYYSLDKKKQYVMVTNLGAEDSIFGGGPIRSGMTRTEAICSGSLPGGTKRKRC
jgi:hypothetical protein